MRIIVCRSCSTQHNPGDGCFCLVCSGDAFVEQEALNIAEQELPLLAPAETGSIIAAEGDKCDCGATLESGAKVCIYCNQPVSGASSGQYFSVTWPWGGTCIQDRLTVGRVPPAPDELAQRLEQSHLNVSRNHAELYIEAGFLHLRDFDSLNGTYLNGERVSPYQAVRVNPGDRVRFAAILEATISASND